jgi:hypothetical protein
MGKRFVFGVVCLSSFVLLAADKVQPFDVKVGLWEVTHTITSSGMPPIPPEMLARLTPEQRAKMEERMKAHASESPRTKTVRSCLTKERLEKDLAFADDDPACKHTIVSSTSSHLEVHLECDREGMKSDGTFKLDAVSRESVKGSVHTVTSGGDNSMTIDSTFTAKYLGSDCGTVKD